MIVISNFTKLKAEQMLCFYGKLFGNWKNKISELQSKKMPHFFSGFYDQQELIIEEENGELKCLWIQMNENRKSKNSSSIWQKPIQRQPLKYSIKQNYTDFIVWFIKYPKWKP
jgi:hypothetical protein